MAGKLIDNDRGWRRLLRTLRKARGRRAHVAVGFIGTGKGADGHGKAEGKTVVEIAAVHEFGTELPNGTKIPQRSMLRATADENRGTYRKLLRRGASNTLAGKTSLRQSLDLVGVKAVGDVRTRISNGIDPENRPRTVARKGSSKPLIDTGQLKGSIDHEVRGA